jgi:hypothetical protein
MNKIDTLKIITGALYALALACALQGCASSAGMAPIPNEAPSDGAAAPDEEGGRGGASGGVSPTAAARADIEREIAQIERRQQGYMEDFGVEGGAAPNAGTEEAGCKELCDVQEAICGSSTRICDISAAHPTDPWFSERCAWADNECTQARAACDRCQP